MCGGGRCFCGERVEQAECVEFCVFGGEFGVGGVGGGLEVKWEAEEFDGGLGAAADTGITSQVVTHVANHSPSRDNIRLCTTHSLLPIPTNRPRRN